MSTTPPAPESRPGRGAGHTVLIVIGALIVVIALVIMAAGGALLWAHTTQRNSDGFYTTAAERLGTPTYALVSDELDVGTDGPDWLFRKGRLGTIRIAATSRNGRPIFLGIARDSQVSGYLAGVPHAEVTDFDVDPFSVTYALRPGTTAPGSPQQQGFWTASANGTGEQTVTWPVQEGSWAVLLMNADASRGIAADVSAGAKIGLILWLAVGLLAGGAILAAGGGLMIYFGARTRRP